MRIEIGNGHTVDYFEQFLPSEEATRLAAALLASKDLRPEVVHMYGRDIVTGRSTALYGVPYPYNPKAPAPHAWTPLMQAVRERIEPLAGPLDGGLIQVYPQGSVAIGWHEDHGEPEIIASLSLGHERLFAFGVRTDGGFREVWRTRLAHGSLLLIPGATNRAFKHRLIPEPRVEGARVNVTFRRFPTPARRDRDERFRDRGLRTGPRASLERRATSGVHYRLWRPRAR
jgi:alkylated DNA repair dioxygenase AlkB